MHEETKEIQSNALIELSKTINPVTIVLIPLGIPGLGKSTLVNQSIPLLKDLGFRVSTVESDQV